MALFNVLHISFWYFLEESLGSVWRWLTARNAWTFSTYILVFISTIVLLFSA
jgi:hypothetical protein